LVVVGRGAQVGPGDPPGRVIADYSLMKAARRVAVPYLMEVAARPEFRVSSFKNGNNDVMTKRKTRSRGRSAFTLLELLVVIAIIMTVSSIMVASYFGMIRGSSFTAVEKNVYNTLTLARQRACIDGKRVYVMFISSNEFVLVRSAGRITGVNYANSQVYDAYGDLSNQDAFTQAQDSSGSTKIYNMDAAGMAVVASLNIAFPGTPYATNYTVNPPATYNRPELIIGIQNPVPAQPFQVGNLYGLAVYQSQKLPRGFSCVVDGTTPTTADMRKAIFEADGRRGIGSIQNIVVYETIMGNVTHHRVTFTIESDGSITVVRD
jgi:prepilin-type N-terminal cleavage/methylation domain-containing protein